MKKTVGPDWTLVIQQDYTEACANFLNSKSNGLLFIVVHCFYNVDYIDFILHCQ